MKSDNINQNTEINVPNYSLKVPNLMVVDSLLNSLKCGAVTVGLGLAQDMALLKMQLKLRSKYDVFADIDSECKVNGMSKLLNKNIINVDGLEVGISKASFNEMIAFIRSVFSLIMMSNKLYKIRWCLNANFGEQYINDAISAIKHNSQMSYDAIRLVNSIDYGMIRAKTGKAKDRVKITPREKMDMVENVIFDVDILNIL